MKHFLTNFSRMGNAVHTPPIRSAMRSILLLLGLFLLGSLNVWGEEVTVTTTFVSGTGTTTGGQTLKCSEGGLSWVSSGKVNSFDSSSSRGYQFSAVSSDVTTTIDNVTIKEVEVIASSNTAANSMAVTVGSTSFICNDKTSVTITKTNNTTYTWTGNASGEIKVSFIAGESGKSMYVKSIKVTYETSGSGSDLTAVSDDQLAWSAESCTATKDAENSYPTLTNTLELPIEYQSSDPTVASINSSTGEITLNKKGSTTIKAVFAGGEVNSTDYAAKTVTYELNVIEPDSPNGPKTIDLTKDETTTATEDEMTWVGQYVSVAAAKGSASTNTNNYYPGTPNNSYTSTRFYKNSTLTFTPVEGYKITSIVYTATTSDYATALGNSTWTNATASVSSSTVTITPTDGSKAVSATIGGTTGGSQIVINYGPVIKSAVSFSAPTGGTLVIKDGEDAISSGGQFSAGKTLSVDIAPTGTYIGGTVVVKKTSDENDVTTQVLDGTTLTVPDYAITVSATFTPTYAINKVADGGSIALDYTAAGAPDGRAIAGTEITATATADENHTFKSLALSENVTIKEIDGNVATFTMPAGDVTVTATFDEKADPYIALSQTGDYLFDDVAEGAPTNMTFTVSGANLSSNLSVTVSGDAAKFELSTEAIEISGGGVTNYEVTVTPVTTKAGTFEATITVDDGADNAPAKSFDIAITVLPKYTAKWIVNGDTENPYSSQTAVAGTALNIPSNPTATGNCAGLTFMGWVSAAIEGSQDEAPNYVNTEELTMPENGVTYYAVFAEPVTDSEDHEITLTYSSFGSWSGYAEKSCTVGGYDFIVSKGYPGANSSLQMNNNTNGGSGKLYNTTAIAGLKSIKLTAAAAGKTVTVYQGANSGEETTSKGTAAMEEGKDYAIDLDNSNEYFTIQVSGATYFASIVITYAEESISYTNFVTTCSTCAKVTLSAENVENGSIAFQQDSKAVEVVKTCDEAQMVDVVAEPSTGYELTGVELSGVIGANYSDGVISIPQNVSGTLVATATFALKNYSVTMAQTGGAEATISDNQSNKNYGETITVTAHEKEGYIFAGWEATPAVTFADAKALETTFSMPNGNVTVTAKYAKVLTVAEALALIPNSGDDSDGDVYVQAFVSYVNASSFDADYGTQHYYLSDNGARENELMVYYGYKGANSEKFTASNEIKAGDKVVVCGPLTNYSGTKEFKIRASYIFDLTVASHDSYEIVGELTQTAFATGDEFLNSYMANLKVNDVYNTGYKVEVEGVSFSADKTALVAEDEAVHVTATKNDATLAEKDFAITVNSATLESFALKDGYKTEYYVGESFVKPTIIATLSDKSNVEAEALNCTGYNMSEAGDYEVTVSYKYGDITLNNVKYSIKVKSIFGNEDAPHTVAVAKALIEASAYQEKVSSTDYMWVRGKVVSEPNSSSTYYISDDGTSANQLTVWQGKYFTTGINAKDNVAQGDEVILKATIVNYSGNQAELTASTVVYQLREGTLSIEDVEEMEVNVTADLGVEDLTINKNGSNGAISFVSGNTDALTIVDGKLHAIGNATADVEVTATMAATENTGSINYTEAEATFNVHVIAERTRYAVTFNADGGTGADPVIASQLVGATVELPAVCPYSKANSAFAGWVVTETVSGNAVTVTDGHFTMPAAAVTITATWNTVETCAISFVVNGEEVTTANAPQTAPYTLSQEGPVVEGFTFLGWSETAYANETATLPTMIENYTPEAGEATKELYGIYSQVDETGGNLHYVLDYSADVADKSIAYNSEVNITATDGSEWIVSASKQTGMQINTGKGAYIKVPDCPANIIQIVLTCNSGAQKAVAFSESSDGAAIVTSPNDGTSQTLDFSGVNARAGYIIPSAGNCQITHIDVEYSGSVTYYTSSPVTRYKVTYLKGEASNVTGICAAERLAAGEITLCAAPTCEDKNFVKWSDGENLYEAGASYQLGSDMTFTATWAPKPTYTVRYDANGGVGEAPAGVEYMEDNVVTVEAGNDYFTNPGKVFDGWKVTYNDGVAEQVIALEDDHFTMVAYNVVIKATWAEESKQKWALVTDASQLVAGDKYVIAAADYNYAMAGQKDNNRAQTSITKKGENGSILMGTSAMQIITLEGTTGAWEFNVGDGYLYAASNNSNHLKTQAENDVNGKWAITFNEGAASIVATNSTNRSVMQYNQSSDIFSCYSTASQKAVALYKEIPLTQITADGKNQEAVPDGGDMIIGEDKTWTVSAAKEVGDLYMEDGAVIANSANLTAQDLYFKTKPGVKSNQIYDATELNVVGDFYYDYQLCEGTLDADYWYSIAAPFDVDINNGIYLADGTKLTNHADYEVWEYDTEKRAETMSNGWKRVPGNKMVAGKAYLIGFNPGMPNVVRLKAAPGWKSNLFSGATLGLTEAEAAEGTHSNWNGIANPSFRYVDVNMDAQVFNNNTHAFDPFVHGTFNFIVGVAFFVQGTGNITFGNTDHGVYRAPKRESNRYTYSVRIAKAEAESYDNQVVVRASEDASNAYEQGHDMLTMNDATSKTTALLWTKNYGGKRLAIEEAPLTDGQATYELGIYAPAAGTYTISVADAKDNADLYLTLNGTIIWNLSMSDYEIDLAKGTAEGYGLMLVSKAPMVTTGVDNINASESGAQKVIINEHVYILRGEKMYDATGKMVK